MKSLLVSISILVCAQARAALPEFDCSRVKAEEIASLCDSLSPEDLEALKSTCDAQADELVAKSKASWLPTRGLHFAERANAARDVALYAATLRLDRTIAETSAALDQLKRDIDAMNADAGAK